MRYRQQLAHSPSRQHQQLLAVHRLPDKTELVQIAPYTDAWDAASRRSRSRRVFAAEPDLQTHHPRSRDGTMRVETTADVTDSRGSERRMSNAGSELGDWINKYQKSDHHADRLVRTILHYEQTTGQRFPGISNQYTTHHHRRRHHLTYFSQALKNNKKHEHKHDNRARKHRDRQKLQKVNSDST